MKRLLFILPTLICFSAISQIKISQLPALSGNCDTCKFPIVKTGTTYKASGGQVAWGLSGNSATSASTNFIGTTDNTPLIFKVDNSVSGQLGVYTDFSGGTNIITTGVIYPAPSGTTFGQTLFGKFAGENIGTTWNTNSTVFGHGALRKASQAGWIGGSTPQMTVIGANAGFYTKGTLDGSGNRSVFIGQSAGYRNFKGSSNVFVGSYAGELNNNGSFNTGIGRDVLRSNIDGTGNVAAGLFSLLYNSTGIASIPVSSGGSGYTSATVTISAPMVGSPGGYVSTATATATVGGGQVTGITITDPGRGYSLDPHTFDWGTQGSIVVTISGDGTGAVAGTPVLQSGNYNTQLGYASGFGNYIGAYNTAVGNFAGSGRGWDDYTTFIGSNSGVDGSVTNSFATKLVNTTAIGYNAKTASSNSLILGGTGADAVRVGVGTINPDASSVLDIVSTTKGILPPRMTTAQRDAISSPVAGLTLYCTDCTANDASTGVIQTYNGTTWKNHW